MNALNRDFPPLCKLDVHFYNKNQVQKEKNEQEKLMLTLE